MVISASAASSPITPKENVFPAKPHDLAKVGVGEDFLDEVGQHLQPGKAAVVAEVWEEWVMPVDTRMEAAGGVVFRCARGEVLDYQLERDAAALKAEVADRKAEDAQAGKDE